MKYLHLISLLILFSLQALMAQTPFQKAVDIRVKTIEGENIRLYDLLDQGKIAVIDFFSTSCGPCNLYAPDHQAIYKKYGHNQGEVFFMGVAWGDTNEGVYVFDTTYGIEYPTASGIEGGGNIANNDFEIMSHPTVLVIMPDHTIVGNLFMPYDIPDFEHIDSVLLANGAMPTALQEQALAQNFSIYPNPATDRLTINFHGKNPDVLKLRIHDLSGKLVFEDFHPAQKGGITLNLNTFADGIYFLETETQGKTYTQKLMIKQRN